MEIKVKKVIVVLLALLFNQLVSSQVMANGDSGERTISSIKVEANDFIAIKANADWDNPDQCGRSHMVYLSPEEALYKDKLSLIIAAQMSGKPMSFWLTGCVDTPWGFSIPRVYSANLNK